ncbi:hypothetical protein [Marinobacter sp. OP 3.4]|uniref:hypothetical protein n=1 Tax=Marinobacter sp. OP 3.4 TaxID=3076501 RepID=UPI002E1BBCA4
MGKVVRFQDYAEKIADALMEGLLSRQVTRDDVVRAVLETEPMQFAEGDILLRGLDGEAQEGCRPGRPRDNAPIFADDFLRDH